MKPHQPAQAGQLQGLVTLAIAAAVAASVSISLTLDGLPALTVTRAGVVQTFTGKRQGFDAWLRCVGDAARAVRWLGGDVAPLNAIALTVWSIPAPSRAVIGSIPSAPKRPLAIALPPRLTDLPPPFDF